MLGDRDKMRENLLAIREDYWSNHITTHAKRLPQEKRTAAVSAVRRMAAILAGCSPLEKAVLLYRMYTYNITYDYDTYRSPERNGQHIAFDFYGALTGKAVCSGIAELYCMALVAAGLDAVIVVGYALGPDGPDLHGWVKLRIDGRWYNADPTWDLAACGRRGQPKFFLRSDAWMEAHEHYSLPERYPAAPAELDPTRRETVERIYQTKGVDEVLWKIWESSRKGMA